MIHTDHLYRRYQVFISSTYRDLIEERSELRKQLSKSNYIVEGMELFPAANKKQWDVIKERINKSDLYVLIIADRFGSIASNSHSWEPTLAAEGEVLSFTQLEFRYAKSIGLPVLAFIKQERKEEEGVAKFISEVQGVGAELTTARWGSTVDLVGEVLGGLKNEIENKGFASKNGWIKANSLFEPMHFGDESVFLESKLHYVKMTSYSLKRPGQQPLYTKGIPRLEKQFDVWDEYSTVTVNCFSHFISGFQFYARTDGDAMDFAAFLPYVEKFTFADIQEGKKDTIINPFIGVPSNIFVTGTSVLNGFQDGNTDLSVKATHDTKCLRLTVDFSSIAKHDQLFSLAGCVEVDDKGSEVDVQSPSNVAVKNGVYFAERANVKKGKVLKLKFKVNND